MIEPELTVEQIDALRFTAFRSNAPGDLEAYYKATSKWFQDRHYRDMAADDALAAHVAAEVAKARAEDAAKLALPADVLEFALKIGRAEWGQTDPKTAAEHAADMASSVEKTAAHFGQTEPQSLNGLYIEGTSIVICHTGVSPNSPEIARILTGLWNMIYDVAQIGAKP